jgi:hypothetical protein
MLVSDTCVAVIFMFKCIGIIDYLFAKIGKYFWWAKWGEGGEKGEKSEK